LLHKFTTNTLFIGTVEDGYHYSNYLNWFFRECNVDINNIKYNDCETIKFYKFLMKNVNQLSPLNSDYTVESIANDETLITLINRKTQYLIIHIDSKGATKFLPTKTELTGGSAKLSFLCNGTNQLCFYV